MIKGTEFHLEYLKQLNRINSNWGKSVSVAARDSYFNQAKDIVFENLFAVSEKNTTVRNHLRDFEMKRKKISCKRKSDTMSYFEYPDNFYRLLRQDAYMHTDYCSTVREVTVTTVQTDDLPEILRDPHQDPSFEWRETVGEEGSEGYYIYTKEGYHVEYVLIDYMRKPKNIYTFSLIDCEGGAYINSRGEEITEDQDFESDSTYLWRKIVDVAIVYTLRDLGQIDDFSAKMQEILFLDKVYLK